MKKILAIAPYPYLPFFSGGQKYIAGFYEHLARVCDLTVISTRNNDVTLARGYRLLPLLRRSFTRYYDTGLVSVLQKEIEAGKYDAIIWEHPYYAWLAGKLQRRTGVRTILHTHNIEHLRFKSLGKWWWRILRGYERKFFREADLLMFISNADREFAISQWQVDPAKCVDVPYGIEISHFPEGREKAKETIRQKHNLASDERIFLFNGLLNYGPNLDALKIILDEINPMLTNREGIRYRILICGRGLPAEMRGLEAYAAQNIVFAGFVEDISSYFLAADVFLNPILAGGGVKTKLVEAIAYGCTVISTETGAVGVKKEFCGKKLVEVKDGDWEDFAGQVLQASRENTETPQSYYDYYYWGKIAEKVASVI